MIHAHTGILDNAGTSDVIHVVIHGDDGDVSREIEFRLGIPSGMNTSRPSQVDVLVVPKERTGGITPDTKLDRLEIWKSDAFPSREDSDWFLEKIILDNELKKENFTFPVLRWIGKLECPL